MINKISETTKQNTIRKSVKNVPTQPSAVGITEQQLKDRFAGIVTDSTNSAYAEIDRVVDEANAELQARDNAFNEHINNAEIHKPNVIEKILVNDVEKQPDIDKAVNITAEDLGAGKPNGLATLDENQKLKTEQLPEGINIYEYYDSFEELPETGESGVTYIDRSTNNVYLWTGSDYTNITAQLALGETSNTAYRGDRGKIAYDHSQSTGNPHQTAFDEILDKPTTLAGYGITDALKKGDQSKVVNDAFVSRITATNDVEIIDSPVSLKAAVIKSIKGLSIKAIQKSGDFRTGALNDWSANAGYALSIGNNILTVTVNTDTPGQVVLTNNVQAQPDRAHFIMCYVKTIAATSVQVGFSDGVKSVAKTTTANRWNYVSSKLSTNALSSPQIIVDCSSMTNGDSFQVCLFEVIDLEDSGIQDWTNEKLDATIPLLEYFEDVRHSNPTQFKSIGDNLIKFIPKTFSYAGVTMRVDADGTITLNGTSTGAGDFSIISSGTGNIFLKYSILDLKLVVEHISGSISGGSLTVYADGRLVNDGTSYYGQQLTCTIPNGSTGGIYTGWIANNRPGYPHHLRVFVGSGRTLNNVKLRVMLLHADNPLTEYKPYTEHILELPWDVPKLPNGVADEFNLTTKTYIRRVGKIVIDGTQDMSYIMGSGVGGTYAYYVTIPGYKIPGADELNILADRLPVTLNAQDETYPCVSPSSSGRIIIRDYLPAIDVSEAKKYLAQNPITLWFELDEPVVEPLDVVELLDKDSYLAWNYGLEQLYNDNGELEIAQLEIEYPLDLAKQVDTNTWLIAKGAGAGNKLDKSGHPANKVLVTNSNGEITTTMAAANQVVLGDGTGRPITTSVTSGSSSLVTSGAVAERLADLGFKTGTVTVQNSSYYSSSEIMQQGRVVIGTITFKWPSMNVTSTGSDVITIGTLNTVEPVSGKKRLYTHYDEYRHGSYGSYVTSYTCAYYINSRTLTCERSWYQSTGASDHTFSGGSITVVLAYCPVQNRYYFGPLTK